MDKKIKKLKRLALFSWLAFFIVPVPCILLSQKLPTGVLALGMFVVTPVLFIMAIVFSIKYGFAKKPYPTDTSRRSPMYQEMLQPSGQPVRPPQPAAETEPEPQPAAAETNDEPASDRVVKEYRRYLIFPKKSLTTDLNELQHYVDSLCKVFDVLTPVINTPPNTVASVMEDLKNEENTFMLIGEKIDKTFSAVAWDAVKKAMMNSTPEELSESFILLDFYAYFLKENDTKNICIARELVAEQLLPIFALMDKVSEKGKQKECSEKEGIELLLSKEQLYIMVTEATGKMPMLDADYCAWLFTEEWAAQIMQEQYSKAHFRYASISFTSLTALTYSVFYAYGIDRFKLNPGALDLPRTVIRRDALFPHDNIKGDDMYGSALNRRILRYRVCKGAQTEEADEAAKQELKQILAVLPNNVFLVPFTYGDEPLNVEDKWIHYTLGALEKLNRLAVCSQLGLSHDAAIELEGDLTQGNYAREELIPGHGLRRFVAPGDVPAGKTMYPRVLETEDKAFLCAFTDFAPLCALFGEQIRVAVMTFEEIAAHLDDGNTNSKPIMGLVINPNGNELHLSKLMIGMSQEAAQQKESESGTFVIN